MADDDDNGNGTDEPASEPEGHHCEHCDDIAELREGQIKLAAAIAVSANTEEDAALGVLADAFEIPADEPAAE